MIEDRSAAMFDTSEQPAITPKMAPVARGGLRRFAAFVVCTVCLTALIGLILVYALVPLPEWLSLLTGVTIVLVFAAMIAGIGMATHAPSDWE